MSKRKKRKRLAKLKERNIISEVKENIEENDDKLDEAVHIHDQLVFAEEESEEELEIEVVFEKEKKKRKYRKSKKIGT